jgi:hypothetical protein
LTPSTILARVSASDFAFSSLAEPVSVTTPLVVVTLILELLRLDSLIRRAFTLAVIEVSLIAAPTLSLCACGTAPSSEAAEATPAKPRDKPPAIRRVLSETLRNEIMFFMSLLLLVVYTIVYEKFATLVLLAVSYVCLFGIAHCQMGEPVMLP